MRRNFYICIYFALLLVVLLACVQDFDGADYHKQNDEYLTISEAKEFFENTIVNSVTSRSTIADSEPDGLIPENFAPMWHKSNTFENDSIGSVDLPIVSSNSYFAKCMMPDNGKIRIFHVALSQRLIVVKNKTDKSIYHYVMSLVPDREYYLTNKGDISEKFLYSPNRGNFSGIIIVTSPELDVTLQVSQYKNGRVISEVFLPSSDEEVLHNHSLVAQRLLEHISVYYYENQVLSRSESDAILIETVTCWGSGFNCPGSDNMFYGGITYPGGGGGGGGTPPTINQVAPNAVKIFKPSSNISLEQWKYLEQLINKLREDCFNRYISNMMSGVDVSIGSSPEYGLNGTYNPTTNSMNLYNIYDSGGFTTLLHEMFHGAQNDYYGGISQYFNDYGHPNIEYESYVFVSMYEARNFSSVTTNVVRGLETKEEYNKDTSLLSQYGSYGVNTSYLNTMYYRYSSSFASAHGLSINNLDPNMKFNFINSIKANSGC